MHVFHADLNKQRRARGLSWTELAAEINQPFESTPSIPIHQGTLRDMLKWRSVTSAVVLQVLRWMGRIPESFLSSPARTTGADKNLPEVGLDRILRFDTRAIYDRSTTGTSQATPDLATGR